MRKKGQSGFALVEAIVILVVVIIVVLGWIYVFFSQRKERQAEQAKAPVTASLPSASKDAATGEVLWEWTGEAWKASGVPSACNDPLSMASPVDTSLATATLYPGQSRGGDYKSHGGFLFAGRKNEDITVKAPMDARLVKASRYIEQGQVQYFFVFVAPCGIMYRFDHLLTLSPRFQAIADALPPAQVDDSRTTNINPAPEVKAGEAIATAVGFKNGNVSVDFGVNDLRAPNAVSKNAQWMAQHKNEYDPYGVCWLDLLVGADAARVRGLPAGDKGSGKASDYCE